MTSWADTLAKLRRRGEAAQAIDPETGRPGLPAAPWYVEWPPEQGGAFTVWGSGGWAMPLVASGVSGPMEWVAAANPSVVLRLIEERDRLAETVEAMSGDAADLIEVMDEAAALRTALAHVLVRTHDTGCGVCDAARALLTSERPAALSQDREGEGTPQ